MIEERAIENQLSKKLRSTSHKSNHNLKCQLNKSTLNLLSSSKTNQTSKISINKINWLIRTWW